MSIYTDVRTASRNSIIQSLISYFPTVADQDAGIIFSHLSGAEPSIPYVVINILSIEQQGHHSTSTLTSTAKQLSVAAFYEVMVQYSFSGSTAGSMAHDFSHKVSNSPIVFQEQETSKLAFMRKSTVRRAPQKRDTTWIENFNIDVTYNYVANEMQTIDWVDGIVVDHVINGVTSTQKIPKTITYP
jgi:hypothetical protein